MKKSVPLTAEGRYTTTLRDIAVIVACMVVGGVSVWIPLHRTAAVLAPVGPPIPVEPLSIAGATTLGQAAAPVVIIEFSDFQCPFCGLFASEVLPQLKATYIQEGIMQLAFRHWPLPTHPRAERAAEAAICADSLRGFWPMHDLLFASRGKFHEKELVNYSLQADLDQVAFSRCMAGRAVSRVRQDVDQAKALGLQATPTFLIGQRRADGRVSVTSILVGARPLKDFGAAIDHARAAKPRS